MRKTVIFVIAALLLLSAGCAPKRMSGFASEPMDAAIFDVLSDDDRTQFAAFDQNPPVSMMVRYDQMYPDATVTDAALIRQMYDAIKPIRIAAKTNMCITDGYHCVLFTTADGESYGLSFEHHLLSVKDARYELANAEAFWKLFKQIAQDYYEQSCEDQRQEQRVLGAPLFDFYGDQELSEFAESFYTNMPDSLTISCFTDSFTDSTFTDAQTITAVFEAMKAVVVEAPADDRSSDYDTRITFSFEDRSEYSFCFNENRLKPEIGIGGLEAYALSGSEPLTRLVKELHGGK